MEITPEQREFIEQLQQQQGKQQVPADMNGPQQQVSPQYTTQPNQHKRNTNQQHIGTTGYRAKNSKKHYKPPQEGKKIKETYTTSQPQHPHLSYTMELHPTLPPNHTTNKQ